MHRMTIQYAGPADPDAFTRHYREVHVPLARTLPGVRRFTVSQPRSRDAAAPYLVAELWFDDADALKAAVTSPEMGPVLADAQGFDVASMISFTGEVEDLL